MKILKKVLNYDIEIVHGDQSSISFRVGHRLFLIVNQKIKLINCIYHITIWILQSIN